MAEVQEPTFNSLADRIAALNQQKNFTTPSPSAGKRAPPPPPPGKPVSKRSDPPVVQAPAKSPRIPARPQKRDAPALPTRTNTSNSTTTIASPPIIPSRSAPPPLPGRKDSTLVNPSPALPPRRPSTQYLATRRGSNSSDVSQISAISNLSLAPTLSRTTTATSTEGPAARRVLAPTLDQAKLPPLPPSRKEREEQAAREEAAAQEAKQIHKPPVLPGRSASAIPQLPSRPGLPYRAPSGSPNPDRADPAPANGARRLPPPPSAFVRPHTTLGSTKPPPLPNGTRPPPRPVDDAPPPVPVTSRPTFAQIDAVTERAVANQAAACLICRDFSGPDSVAAQYPVPSLPRHDPVSYLANALCGPFPSATDKARAIFTWCHHNIRYNVEEFFGKCVQRRSVDETIFHGKAVCQGYAEVYAAIAQRAGLQCVLVSGHGKGFGFTPLADGQPVPPRDHNHAWNAVCIDNGEWKLIDACWGAGHLGSGQQYEQKFSPDMFFLSNEHFGLRHFPSDERYFFRKDGRSLTWEEYIIGPTGGETAGVCGRMSGEGLSEFTFQPAQKRISVHNSPQPVVRFQFAKICEHWDPARNNGNRKPFLLMMKIHGRDGRKDDYVPLDTDGFWWWADIPAVDLGAPGQKIFLYALETLNGRDARGTTKRDYLDFRARGGGSMSWAQWVTWDLV
ncbi:hypothetical protein F4778DRAFT_695117 [Xylariomycetidae sp. FL2044]|nr:hypothetical protein F4778DRAFT_695117 [Xylariomycetidae sp. FL2044]